MTRHETVNLIITTLAENELGILLEMKEMHQIESMETISILLKNNINQSS